MKRNLLIHSLSELKSIYLPLLEIAEPKKIAEIGVEFAGNTKVLLEYIEKYNAELHSIEPLPSEQTAKLFNKQKNAYLYKNKSLSVIDKLPTISTWFIDGDHNWYTVYNELMAIHKKCSQLKESMIFLHDVGFPWARRDLYYNPSDIPNHFLHEYCWESGVLYNDSIEKNKGFRGCGHFAIAKQSGTGKNGVLTAVEDFLKDIPDHYQFFNIPAVFGLGILISKTHPEFSRLEQALRPFHNNLLLEKLEDNRLSNYLRVIEMQDEKHK